MYIERLDLENIRTFTRGKPLIFVHPDGDYRTQHSDRDARLPKPRLPNVNLLLGDNGSGKTTVLRYRRQSTAHGVCQAVAVYKSLLDYMLPRPQFSTSFFPEGHP